MVKIINKIGHSVLLILASFLFYGCPEDTIDRDLIITINNKSTSKILYYSYLTNPKDTSVITNIPWYNIESSVINPEELKGEFTTSSVVKEQFEIGYTKHFYVFIYDSIKTIPWERVRDEYIVAKRVDFDTWEELEAADFKVTYP